MFNRKYRIRTKDQVVIDLPDGEHTANIFIYERTIFCSVVRDSDFRVKQDFKIDRTKPGADDLMEAFIELAEKKYPRPLRGKREELFFNIRRRR